MLDVDEKGSNLSTSVQIMLYKWAFLFSAVLAKKMRKSLILMKKMPNGCISRRKRGSMKFREPEKQI